MLACDNRVCQVTVHTGVEPEAALYRAFQAMTDKFGPPDCHPTDRPEHSKYWVWFWGPAASGRSIHLRSYARRVVVDFNTPEGDALVGSAREASGL